MIHDPAVTDVREQLRKLLREVRHRAYVPYSKHPEAVVLLLSDGSWIPGVRVESASFSLTIPPLQNAWTTAVALNRRDVVAVAFSQSPDAGTRAFLEELKLSLQDVSSDLFASQPSGLPIPRESLAPFLDQMPEGSLEGIQLAREVAARALAPYSRFPVGCLLQLEDGRCIPGVNVEHPDWTRTLCAERNALGTAISYGLVPSSWRALFLSCVNDSRGTPCGACRQLLAEHRSDLPVWMDGGFENPLRISRVDLLLPGFFVLQ